MLRPSSAKPGGDAPSSLRPAGAPDDFRWAHHQVWAIAGPAILANSSAPLVGLVDTWAIGHIPDPAYLAAVGLGSVIFSYLLWVFGFLRMGATGLVAQARGRVDDRGLVETALRSCALGLLFSLALLVLHPMSEAWGLAGLWGAVLIFMASRGIAQVAWYPLLERKLN